MPGGNRRPPGPRGGFLTGNLAAYDRDRLGFLRRCQQEYGDWVSIGSRTVLVGDAEAIGQILTADAAFSLESGSDDRVGGPATLAARAAEHALARRSIARGLARVAPERGIPGLHAILEQSIADLRGQHVDLTSLLRRAFGAAAVKYMTSNGDVTIVDALAELHAAGIAITAESVDLPRWLPSARRRRLRRAHIRAAGCLRELTGRQPDEPGTQPYTDVLDAVITDGGGRAARRRLEMGLMAALRSSFGGTGVAATWAIKEVARRPEVRDRLEAELPAGSDRPYLSALVKEVLRLHPPVWQLQREALVPADLGGWTFRPGDRLLICPWLLHRDPRWWTDPEAFDPDRWLGPERLAHPSVYLPFGAGARACLGARLATYQLHAGLAYLWSHTRIELDEPGDTAEGCAAALLFPAQSGGRILLRPDEEQPSAATTADGDTADGGLMTVSWRRSCWEAG